MDNPASVLFPAAALAPRFVLLVGDALRPAPEVVAEMAQDGLRSLWRASGEQALRTAAIAHFDAVCLDSAALGGPSAWTLTRLREALSCPIAVIGNGLDAQEELSALDHGADLYLARPLPPRRLCAHLLALLRRPRVVAGREPALHVASARRDSPLLERFLQAATRSTANIAVDGSDGAQVSTTASTATDGDGYDVYIQGLHLRLR